MCACLCSTCKCVARPLNSEYIFSICIFLHWGRSLGRYLGVQSGRHTVSGPGSTLCFAPFCGFLETWLPCVALPGPWDNSQYISVLVTLAECLCVCMCVCLHLLDCAFHFLVQFLVQVCNWVNAEHRTFLSEMSFEWRYTFLFSAVQSWDVWLFWDTNILWWIITRNLIARLQKFNNCCRTQ